jgi:hypothetical protein
LRNLKKREIRANVKSTKESDTNSNTKGWKEIGYTIVGSNHQVDPKAHHHKMHQHIPVGQTLFDL